MENKNEKIVGALFFIYNLNFKFGEDIGDRIGFFEIFKDEKTSEWINGYAEGWWERNVISKPAYLEGKNKPVEIEAEFYECETWARIFYGKHKTIDVGQTDEELENSLNEFMVRFQKSDSEMVYTFTPAPKTFIRENGLIYDY